MQKQLPVMRLAAAAGSGPIMMAPSSQYRLSAGNAANASALLGLASPVDALKQSSGEWVGGRSCVCLCVGRGGQEDAVAGGAARVCTRALHKKRASSPHNALARNLPMTHGAKRMPARV